MPSSSASAAGRSSGPAAPPRSTSSSAAATTPTACPPPPTCSRSTRAWSSPVPIGELRAHPRPARAGGVRLRPALDRRQPLRRPGGGRHRRRARTCVVAPTEAPDRGGGDRRRRGRRPGRTALGLPRPHLGARPQRRPRPGVPWSSTGRPRRCAVPGAHRAPRHRAARLARRQPAGGRRARPARRTASSRRGSGTTPPGAVLGLHPAAGAAAARRGHRADPRHRLALADDGLGAEGHHHRGPLAGAHGLRRRGPGRDRRPAARRPCAAASARSCPSRWTLVEVYAVAGRAVVRPDPARALGARPAARADVAHLRRLSPPQARAPAVAVVRRRAAGMAGCSTRPSTCSSAAGAWGATGRAGCSARPAAPACRAGPRVAWPTPVPDGLVTPWVDGGVRRCGASAGGGTQGPRPVGPPPGAGRPARAGGPRRRRRPRPGGAAAAGPGAVAAGRRPSARLRGHRGARAPGRGPRTSRADRSAVAPLLVSRGAADQAGLDAGGRGPPTWPARCTVPPPRSRASAAGGRRAHVVVCDDVLTTGSTAREAQRALEAVGPAARRGRRRGGHPAARRTCGPSRPTGDPTVGPMRLRG